MSSHFNPCLSKDEIGAIERRYLDGMETLNKIFNSRPREETVALYEEKILRMESENEKLEKEIESLKENNFKAATLKADYDNLKNQFNYHYEHLQQRIGQAESLLKERDALKAEVESLKKTIEELRKANGFLVEKISNETVKVHPDILAKAGINKKEAKPEPKFKVGDRFSDILGDFENGKVKASFRKIGGDSRNEFLYEVEHEGYCPVTDENCVFCESQMQKTVQTQDLKVGDKVKVDLEGEIAVEGRSILIYKKYIKKIEG
jgi:DNA repair exonuclease SbcCD ATPase subunit